MRTSGPIRKTQEDLKANRSCLSDMSKADFKILGNIAPNIMKASFDGKIWLLKTARTKDTLGHQLLRREYEITRNLQHPYIASVAGFNRNDPGEPAIIMEYIEGRTLTDYIAENPSTKDRKKVLFEILDAIDYLHAKGLLHNDIKTDNIMISNIGNHIKIIDFGLAEDRVEPVFRRLGGTLGASAPEVLEGRTDIPSDASSDIWSLGVIISGLFPKKYSSIVRKCTQNDPLSRFRDISSLRRALNRNDRWPVTVAASAVAVLLLAAAIVPDVQQDSKARKAQIAVENKKAQIKKDIQELWAPTSDSLHSQKLVGYNEFAQLIFGDFADKFGKYRQNYTETGNETYLGIIDSIYEQIWKEYLSIMQDLPSFNQLESSGKISAKEAAWYSYLCSTGKRFIPYTGQTAPKPWWDPAWDALLNK